MQQQPVVPLLAILAGAAVMHGVTPVSDFLVMTWMIVGLGGAIFLSLMLLEARTHTQLDPPARFHWILLIAYLAHQFEEHGVDLFGRAYYLITYTKILIDDVGAATGFQLTPLAIYRTNTLSFGFRSSPPSGDTGASSGRASLRAVSFSRTLSSTSASLFGGRSTIPASARPSCSFCRSLFFTSASWRGTAASDGRALWVACSSALRSTACSSFAFGST